MRSGTDMSQFLRIFPTYSIYYDAPKKDVPEG